MITVDWDASTDGNSDIAEATADFSAFGGGAAVAMTDVNSDGTLWRASYALTAGTLDGTNLNTSVTATDDAGNATTTADTSNLTADTQAPTVSDAHIDISGATGTGGAFKVGDTVTATWDNTGTGDNNSDIASVNLDFSAFGGSAAVAATNNSGTWTATYTITEDGGGSNIIDGTGLDVVVTATDDAGLTTTAADSTGATVDNDSPSAPTATLAVDENSANTTAVGTVTGGGSDGVTYSLTDDAGGRFTINGSGNVTVANGSLLDHETNATHDVTVRATDDAGNTTDATLSVTVSDVNELPTLDLDDDDSSGAGGSNFSTTFSANGAAVTIADADAALADEDAGDQIESLTTTLSSRPDGDSVESLSLDTGATTAATDNGLAVSYTESTGVLSITGAADASVYQAILRGIQYHNTDAATDITTGNRTIEVVANDGTGDSNTATSTFDVVTAPVIDLGGDGGSGDLTANYTEGDGAVSLADAATLVEPDGDNLNQLVIQLTNAPDGAAETITLSGGSGTRGAITVTYDSDAQITLSGSASTTDYQGLLRELQYEHTSNDPDTTERSITVQGRDVNGNTGAAATLTLGMKGVNDAPTLTATASNPTFTEDGAAAGLFTNSAIDAVEAADNIDEITLSVSDLADGSDELLSVDGEEVALTDGTTGATASNGFGYAVSVSGTTATVTLSKNDTSTHWQTLLDGLGYRNASDDPDTTARTVTLTSVRDTGGTPNGGSDTTSGLSIASSVTITPVNDAPTIATNSVPSVQTGNTLTFNNTYLNEGDPDDDGAELTYTLDTLPTSGTLLINNTELTVDDIFTQQDIDDDLISFQAGSTSGTVSFDITLADGGEDGVGTVSDTVSLSVTASPPPPAPTPEPTPEPTPGPDSDNDGIADDTEQQVPSLDGSSTGDGNGDGIADVEQDNVSSVPFLNTNTAESNPGDAPAVFVTLASQGGDGAGDDSAPALRNIRQLDAPEERPDDMDMPLGLIAFEADTDTAGGSREFSLFVDGDINANGYWKQDATGDWVNLASADFGGSVTREGSKLRLDFVLEDGGEFDADGVADGVITDPGAIGFRQMDEPSPEPIPEPAPGTPFNSQTPGLEDFSWIWQSLG